MSLFKFVLQTHLS